MADKTWETLDIDLHHARMGVNTQAELFMSPIVRNNREVKDFMHHMVTVLAAYESQCRFMRNAMHQSLNTED